MRLNLSSPREMTFLISVIIAALALLGQVVALPFFTMYGFGMLLIAYIILLLGVLLHNM
jgi:hypothetical protein